MYIAVLGRQTDISMAELERVYGDVSVNHFSKYTATVNHPTFVLDRLGGSLKAAKVDLTINGNDWSSASQQIISYYSKLFYKSQAKITLGISVYDSNLSSSQVQKVGIVLKSMLKNKGISMRLVPNQTPALSSATSHHNKLGLNDTKIELIIAFGKTSIVIGRSIGTQNITAYSKRDQARPRRDPFVGMLPPKLAQIMINLATGDLSLDDSKKSKATILDPFCGTGVILQEAALSGFQIYGTDLSQKMIDYTSENLKWLFTTHKIGTVTKLHIGDAMDTTWHQPLDYVVSEVYLGQPFSAPPTPDKLRQVVKNCEFITANFIKNISKQLKTGSTMCLAVPAWKNQSGSFTHLPIKKYLSLNNLAEIKTKTAIKSPLIYHREDQIVARELLLLSKV